MPIVVDLDDAVFHNYDLHPSRLVRRMLGRKIDEIMARANAVVCGSPYLQERARQAGAKNVHLVPTVIDLDRYAAAPPSSSGDTFTIGWIGSPATSHFLLPIFPVLDAFSKRWKTRVVLVGVEAGLPLPKCAEVRAWSEDTEVQLLREMDVGIMPLPDGPWERGKCGYKLIQYMACGKPVVASPVGANPHIVSHGVNGYLADTVDDWRNAFELLAGSALLRRTLGQRGRTLVEDVYCVQKQVGRIVSIFRDATRTKR
jgi:glycosyltransferase involved in cell wall biosynthesis